MSSESNYSYLAVHSASRTVHIPVKTLKRFAAQGIVPSAMARRSKVLFICEYSLMLYFDRVNYVVMNQLEFDWEAAA